MKAWLQLVSIGVIGGLLASSCVITSDDDDDDDDSGGEAGEESTGGRATGGTSTGGRATGGTSTGGRATGGTSTGGAATGGQAPSACDVEEFEPASTCDFDESDACTMCLSGSCCDEIKECYAVDPVASRCGYGITDSQDSEFDCSAACLANIYADGNFPNDDDVDDCVGSCMTCSLPVLGTLGLSQCLVDSCLEECFGE